MSEKKIDLLDDLLEIEGKEPVDLVIGGHTLRIRRAHSGMQIVEWQALEVKRIEARESALEGDGTDTEKVKKLAEAGMAYLKSMLTFLSEKPTSSKEINAVCKLLESSSGQVMQKVTARIFAESGLFTDRGEHVPFIQPSDPEDSTDD